MPSRSQHRPILVNGPGLVAASYLCRGLHHVLQDLIHVEVCHLLALRKFLERGLVPFDERLDGQDGPELVDGIVRIVRRLHVLLEGLRSQIDRLRHRGLHRVPAATSVDVPSRIFRRLMAPSPALSNEVPTRPLSSSLPLI
jgi:hypothetical protein